MTNPQPNGRAANRHRPDPSSAVRKRLPRAERKDAIIAHATRLFAEEGLKADMRELARRAGITHPALFRYFPSKDALIAEVYQSAFMGRWNPTWEAIIADRSRPLTDRLVALYNSFSVVALSYEWVRLYMFAALSELGVHRDFYQFIEKRLIRPLCAEIRHSFDLPDPSTLPLQKLEIELVWSFHSRIFYLGVRKHIYGMTLPADLDSIIAAEAATMTMGLGPYLESWLGVRATRPER